MAASGEDITLLLERWRSGDVGAEAALIERVYPVLRALSQQRLARGGQITLVATELAHEAYLKLKDQRSDGFQNRGHFFAIAAHVIRRLIVDHLRERGAQKRGGDAMFVTLDAAAGVAAPAQDAIDALDFDRMLTRLERIDARAAKLVELRFFTGLSIEEAAESAGVSPATAKRSWQFARAWLRDQIDNPSPSAPAQ
jgi:RNA polymerase sigma factor (TIGR02999 family)